MSNIHGRNWLRCTKRLAVLLRDRFSCAWCGQLIQVPTLDHLIPRSQQGTNHHHNLVVSCRRCNALRKNRDWQVWAYHRGPQVGMGGTDILRHIRFCVEQPLPLQQARKILQNRSWEEAVMLALETIKGERN